MDHSILGSILGSLYFRKLPFHSRELRSKTDTDRGDRVIATTLLESGPAEQGLSRRTKP